MLRNDAHDEQDFQEFFSSNTDIPQLMQQAGVSEQPQPEFWRELDVPDKIGD